MATHGKQQEQTTRTTTDNKQQEQTTDNKQHQQSPNSTSFHFPYQQKRWEVGKGDMVYQHNGNNNDDKYNKV